MAEEDKAAGPPAARDADRLADENALLRASMAAMLIPAVVWASITNVSATPPTSCHGWSNANRG